MKSLCKTWESRQPTTEANYGLVDDRIAADAAQQPRTRVAINKPCSSVMEKMNITREQAEAAAAALADDPEADSTKNGQARAPKQKS